MSIHSGNSSATSGVVLTEDQREVLSALAALGADDFWRPMDFGGHDGSHHSGTATRLAKRGLVAAREFHSISRIRATRKYAITEAGRAALAAADTSERSDPLREEQDD